MRFTEATAILDSTYFRRTYTHSSSFTDLVILERIIYEIGSAIDDKQEQVAIIVKYIERKLQISCASSSQSYEDGYSTIKPPPPV